MADNIIELDHVSKEYQTGAGPLLILREVSLAVQPGEFVAIVGPSGSGKSTLINMLTGIDRPTSGDVHVADVYLNKLNENQMARWRGRNVGVIFQFFQLLPALTVLENIILPMDFCNTYRPGERKERALGLLEQMGMADQANKLPSAISGGQQQRVAIARALANDPPILVGDEPTGNLDSKTADHIFALFAGLARQDKTVVMVTHERDLAARVPRVVRVQDGRIVEDKPNPPAPFPTREGVVGEANSPPRVSGRGRWRGSQ
ncbi:MAG: ABC transporter ATP-binding protein [Anaerolineae bacterium]